MKMASIRTFSGCVALLVMFGMTPLASAQTRTLRIVCYNIEDDINGATVPLPGLIAPTSNTNAVTSGGVLEGIGEELVGSDGAQPLDILALEETTSNPITVAPIVNGMNAFYGVTNMYAMSTYQGIESGGDTADGNGPNAIVYNTHTVQLVASVPVDPSGGTSKLGSSSGEYREVMRYMFAPTGVTPAAANEFYIYVSHYKSGTTASDLTSRGKEAVIIRNDSAALPSNARIIYVGDYNVTTSAEASYQTIIASGANQGIDPLNTSGATNINWGTSTGNTNILAMETESATNLRYRDDLQVMTTNVFYGTPGGLAYVPGTYHVFGNNGSTAYNGSVNNGANTSLNSDLTAGSTISASQLYLDLSKASDHLPVVADYTIPLPPTAPTAGFAAAPTNGTVPQSVTFVDNSTGSVTNWFWNFGDGATTNVTTNLVYHTYTNAGVFTVAEIVTGSGGSSTNTQTNLITVVTPFQAWQLQYFGCTNCPQAQPGTDADGTGQNNQFKYIAGLNPTNPASVFVFGVALSTNTPATPSLTFSPAVAGRTYTAQFETNVTNGAWQPLTIFTGPVTNGNQVTITDPDAGEAAKFYRINISMP